MKFDIENIIYIIAVIAWLVIGYLKKNKKEKAPATKRPSTSMPPVGGGDDFSTVLEELLGKPRQQKAQQETVPAQKPKYKKKISEPIAAADSTERSIIKSGKTISRISSHKSGFEKRKKEFPSIAEEAHESQVDVRTFFNEPDFDLRKAVIYSEILNSPYNK